MSQRQARRTNYGNWVSSRIILGPAVLALVCAVLGILSLFLLIPAAILALVAAYFAYARFLFSPGGRNVQERIRNVVIEHLCWNGEGTVLDIGCGSGALIVGLARKFPGSRAVGTDYWGGNWDYSQAVCQKNAEAEKVADRVSFQAASASSLPFPDEQFDAVVSNLVFHEVKGTADKVVLIKEALRVLKKGGAFALQDLFYMKGMYGSTEELVKVVQGWGTRDVQLVETRKLPFIPGALKLPFMVGTLGLIKGGK